MSTLIATLRPSGSLGDGSDSTVVTDFITATTTPLVGTLSVLAPTLLPVTANGTIDYLVIVARGAVNDPAPPNTSADELTWALGAAVAHESITAWHRFETIETRRSSNQALDPAGNPWTWANVAALTFLGSAVNYTIAVGESVSLSLADVFVEVWGTSFGPFVHGSGLHGPVTGEGTHDNLAGSGLHGPASGDGTHGDIAGAGLHGPVLGSGKRLGGGT